MRVCVRACVRACVCVCVRACVRAHVMELFVYVYGEVQCEFFRVCVCVCGGRQGGGGQCMWGKAGWVSVCVSVCFVRLHVCSSSSSTSVYLSTRQIGQENYTQNHVCVH